MSPNRALRVASRGSRLALWQSGWIRNRIQGSHSQTAVDIEVIKTTGDRITDVPLARIGDRGLFTKEIDDAVLDGRVDLAVHSLKDVPTSLPDGLCLAAISPRQDPRDAFIGRLGGPGQLSTLPPGSRVGTSSLRRRALLMHLRPDLEIVDLRGNLDTRLNRLDNGDFDGIILAAAGIVRLGWGGRATEMLLSETWIPAVGQGALGVVTREDDIELRQLVQATLHHAPTAACIAAERVFLRSLEGGCQVPIGALATVTVQGLQIDGFVADLDGLTLLRGSETGSLSEATQLGLRLAHNLMEQGAVEILRAIRQEAEIPTIPAP